MSAPADRPDRERTGPSSRRWGAALGAYAGAVCEHSASRGVRVLDWFVDARDAPYWIDLAVVDGRGAIVEFYFNGELGWLQPVGEACGRLTPRRGRTVAEHADRVCVPPRRVAAMIAAALRGRPWSDEADLDPGPWSTDEEYLTALLQALERLGA